MTVVAGEGDRDVVADYARPSLTVTERYDEMVDAVRGVLDASRERATGQSSVEGLASNLASRVLGVDVTTRTVPVSTGQGR